MTLRKRTIKAFGTRGFKKSPSRTRRAVMPVTLREIAIKQCGMRGFRKLDPRLKKVIRNIDALNRGMKPVSRRLMERALS